MTEKQLAALAAGRTERHQKARITKAMATEQREQARLAELITAAVEAKWAERLAGAAAAPPASAPEAAPVVIAPLPQQRESMPVPPVHAAQARQHAVKSLRTSPDGDDSDSEGEFVLVRRRRRVRPTRVPRAETYEADESYAYPEPMQPNYQTQNHTSDWYEHQQPGIRLRWG
jgi:hypothetical protein